STNRALTQNQLSLTASGKARVEKLQVWERLAAALDMPDRARILLGLAPLAPDHATAPAGNGQPDDLEELRRSLTEALEAGTLSDSGLDDWEQTILAYGRATRYTVPGRLLHGLLSDFGDLETQLKARQPAPLQRRPARLTAQFPGMVSLTQTNLGH